MTPEQINTVIAIFTVLLAISTVWLAIATWRMASVTKDSFDLESRPYVVFKGFIFKFFRKKTSDEQRADSKAAVRIGLILSNPGRVLVKYVMKTIRITFSGVTLDKPQFQLMGGTIFPNDETVFWYGTIKDIKITEMPKQGIVEYEIEYFSIAKKRKFTSKRTIEYTILSIEPFDIEWLYLEEKDS